MYGYLESAGKLRVPGGWNIHTRIIFIMIICVISICRDHREIGNQLHTLTDIVLNGRICRIRIIGRKCQILRVMEFMIYLEGALS